MELMLRVRTPDDGCHDVIVGVDPTHTVDELATALAGYLDGSSAAVELTSVRTGLMLAPDLAVADALLMSGDELIIGSPRSIGAVARLPRHAVTADVLAGPDSGSSSLLQPGRSTIGRGSDADVVIGDPTVSRAHLDVDVSTDWSVSVAPRPEAHNGVTVNDTPIGGPTVLERTDVVGLGTTRLAFRPFERADDERTDRLGQIDFHRTPYRPPVIDERDPGPFGPIPDRPEPRRLQVLTAIAPLGAGLMLFAFTRQTQFLALTLMSPLIMIANSFEDRRSGKRRFRDDVADFRSRIVDWWDRLAELAHGERVDRLRAAPDLADLVRRAELRTTDLWARGRDAPDFLRLRLGLGTARAHFAVELDRGGADDLRAEALAAFEGVDELLHVPVTVDLVEHGVLGIHGDHRVVDGVTSALLVQAACLHSPEDLTVVAAVASERPLGWLKWLPHTRSVTSPLSGQHVVTSTADADSLIARLLEVVAFRTADTRSNVDHRWPWMLAVLDATLQPDPAEVARLLDSAVEAGISVVWLADREAQVARRAERILAVRNEGTATVGALWSTDPDIAEVDVEVEQLRSSVADRAARALAPVRDASTASLATSIPRVAPLLDVLGVGKPSASWVAERWSVNRGYGLVFPVGIGADGVVDLDLVDDGPHTLIGGTSGSGKSELLQSMVAALAAQHSPERLNFLFVDYKGGASSKVFERLPHTVGYVTNLSAELSLRALTSLRAELNHRMQIMEGRAKDLCEMQHVAPDDAPASLVIVVDEFATLAKEVPEFVTGVIDIAQRGRSLGIHLVLATQRPSGSVNENILANTNLRISLRMLDRAESTSVIDSPDAAEIPVPLRGRMFIRRGPSQLVAVQSAFSGAPLTTGHDKASVTVGPFDRTDASPRPVSLDPSAEIEATHLDAVIDAIVEANDRLSLRSARRPWRDVLPGVITLDAVLADARTSLEPADAGRRVVVGMTDAPELQDQRPSIVDLEEGGGWLVFGSGGSGKTTLLRTLAVSAISNSGDGDVAVLALDFASRGLAALRPLPQVIDVATGDDREAVSRHLVVLEAELDRRRRLLADSNSENLSAYNLDHAPLPRIIVLIDGFGGFATTFAESGGAGASMAAEIWGERLVRIVTDGRQVGIHTVIAADRRNAVPSRIHSAIANRLIMRHADETGYAEHGIGAARAKSLDLPPGRGLSQGEHVVQIASVSRDPTARGQGDFIVDLADRIGSRRLNVVRSAPLPDLVARGELVPSHRSSHVPIGIADVSGATVEVDLTWSNFTIAGPPRSGRSTALLTCISALRDAAAVYAIGPSSSRLAELDDDDEGQLEVAVGRPDVVAPVLDRLANLVEMGPPVTPPVLVVDDIDMLDDPALNPLWDRLASVDHLRVIAAIESRSLSGYTANPIMNLMRRSRRLLVLQPDDPGEFLQMTGVKSTARPGVRMVPGRGVLLADRVPTVVQVATDTPT